MSVARDRANSHALLQFSQRPLVMSFCQLDTFIAIAQQVAR